MPSPLDPIGRLREATPRWILSGVQQGLAACCCLGALACSEADEPAYQFDLPPGFPSPIVPEDNAMSQPKVELGRHLFYDERLSGNGTQSCASCHEAARAFTEERATSLGSTGEVGLRNAQSLANVAYASTLTWVSPVLTTLEQQIHIPMFGEEPLELAISGNEELVLERLRTDPTYRELYAAAFPRRAEPLDFGVVIDSLACFLRTLISGNSPFDRATYQGDSTAISDSARRGSDLFYSERLECLHCHGGFNFSAAIVFEGGPPRPQAFFNTGLYNLDEEGRYPEGSSGLFEFTGEPAHMGRFRSPSLRNVAVTAPYFHDGSAETLEEVLDSYAAGGRRIEEGPFAGDGRDNPHKSGFLIGFELTPQERLDVLSFLDSLTDPTFLANPAFTDPWESASAAAGRAGEE